MMVMCVNENDQKQGSGGGLTIPLAQEENKKYNVKNNKIYFIKNAIVTGPREGECLSLKRVREDS